MHPEASVMRSMREFGEMLVKPLAIKLLLVGRTLGPYIAIELLLPGGSLLALALWLYRKLAARRLHTRIAL